MLSGVGTKYSCVLDIKSGLILFFFFLGIVVPGTKFKKKKSLRNFFFSLEGGTVRNWENSHSAKLLTRM